MLRKQFNRAGERSIETSTWGLLMAFHGLVSGYLFLLFLGGGSDAWERDRKGKCEQANKQNPGSSRDLRSRAEMWMGHCLCLFSISTNKYLKTIRWILGQAKLKKTREMGAKALPLNYGFASSELRGCFHGTTDFLPEPYGKYFQRTTGSASTKLRVLAEDGSCESGRGVRPTTEDQKRRSFNAGRDAFMLILGEALTGEKR